jgi:hypothetical protein
MKLEFFRQILFSKNTPNTKFYENPSCVEPSFFPFGPTDRRDEVNSSFLSNFPKAPEIVDLISAWFVFSDAH